MSDIFLNQEDAINIILISMEMFKCQEQHLSSSYNYKA